MSRTMLNHSYVEYTGEPYIYYNGVSYQPCTETCYQEHPSRTIVRTNICDDILVDRVPLNGNRDLTLLAKTRMTFNQAPCKRINWSELLNEPFSNIYQSKCN